MSTATIPHRLPHDRSGIAQRLRALVRGREADPAWARPALLALLSATAAAYLINLTASAYANSFYAAAVQAGTASWKALFFGSLDSANFITVDKPPASLWVMALSGRIFGFSSASMLVPSVVEGVISVGLLHAAVKRWFGAGAGLLAGAVLALTPVAALMFRFNNPDALLVCLLVAGAYAMVRALEGASTRWLLITGTFIGFAFLAKMLQAFLVLPAFAAVYLLAAPTGLRRRALQLLAAGVAVIVSAGWWVAIVALWPAGSRPMIDGSSDNSIINLIFGYNGLGRVFGSSGQAGGGSNFSGSPGALRLFNALMGGQASWLLPACVVVFVGGMWMTRRAPRTDRTRAALLLWAGWLFVTGVVFSFSQGVIHTYYTVALAPAIGGVVAVGAVTLWRARERDWVRACLALSALATAIWAFVLLDRTPSWEPWLRYVVVIAGVAAALAMLVPRAQRVSRYTAIVAVIVCLAGPAAYTVQTIGMAHTGSTPSAGPDITATAGQGGGRFAGAAGFGGAGPAGAGSTHFSGARGGAGGGAGGGGQTVSKALRTALEADSTKYRWVAAVSGSQTAASLELATGGKPVMAIGGFSGEGGNLTLAQFKRYVQAGDIHYYVVSSGGASGFGGGASGGGRFAGAARSGTSPSGSISEALFGGPPAGARGSSSSEAGLGGPGVGGGRGGPGASGTAIRIAAWVEAHFKSETIGGATVYNLSGTR